MGHERRPLAPQVISRLAFFRITHWHCRRKFGGSSGKDEPVSAAISTARYKELKQ